MGNGYNYIREIMAMDTDQTEQGVVSTFKFVGVIAKMPGWEFNRGKRSVRIVNHQLIQEWQEHTAWLGDVVMHNGKLYSWTYVGWMEFTPGPCTKYDGPRPEGKPTITYDIKLKEEIMAKKNVFEEKELCLTFIGTTTTAICENATNEELYIDGTWIKSKTGYMTMWNGHLYVFAPDGKWHDLTATNVKTARNTPTNYSKIPYGHLLIKKVHYSGDKTIVMWEDGTKTIVTRGENEDFDPEKGLVMAIAKKVYGNKGNYYNRIKKWLPAPEPDREVLTLKESINRIFGDPKIEYAKKKLAAVQELICDVTFRGGTKAEIVRAIKYSKDLIDFIKGADVDIDASAETYGIVALEAKYQPK